MTKSPTGKETSQDRNMEDKSKLDVLEHHADDDIATMPIDDVTSRLRQLGFDEDRFAQKVEDLLARCGVLKNDAEPLGCDEIETRHDGDESPHDDSAVLVKRDREAGRIFLSNYGGMIAKLGNLSSPELSSKDVDVDGAKATALSLAQLTSLYLRNDSEAKLLLVGRRGAGKTSFLHAIGDAECGTASDFSERYNVAFESHSSGDHFGLELRVGARDWAVEPASPIEPAQGPSIRFRLNKDGKIDRAPDEPTEITDDDPRLCSLQKGLQEACDTFLNSFHGDAGRNAFGPLIDNVEAYRQAITGSLTEIQLTDVYRHGLALQNWVMAGRRDIDRLDPRPDLEDDQQAALSNLLGLHGPFILSTKEGEQLQAKADQDQMTAEERAMFWSPNLSDAAQVSDHATDHAKAILSDVNQPSEDGAISNRRALLALTTKRNFLSATSEAATGKDFSDIGAGAVSEASRSAGRFLLKNEKLISKLVASTHFSLGWLGHLIGWLKTPAAPELPAAPAIITNDFWTPGRIFRDLDEPWCPEMVVIPAGVFMMGSPEDEAGRLDNEGPQHLVTIEKSFVLGRFPVTFGEFDHFCDETGRERPDDHGWGRGRRPVIHVSWHDAAAYCDWLSERIERPYRLPSEAEWEYACRAGSRAAYAFGETIDEKQANFGRHVRKTSEVGAYPANAFKLSDMHGNVWEWCADHYQDSHTGASDNGRPLLLTDETGDRVMRGGSWVSVARNVRGACRSWSDPEDRHDHIGFRCARIQELADE